MPSIPALFVGGDLFFNKVLVGEKLQPLQATVLFLSDDYVTTDLRRLGKSPDSAQSEVETNENSKDADQATDVKPQLTVEQRKTVRDRLLVWAVIGGVVGTLLGIGYWYYQTWIWQGLNQNLRIAMFEHVHRLSLRFHDQAKVGDGMFRIYQDSAMIVNVLTEAILTPLSLLASLAYMLAIIAMFDPLFALIAFATIVVMSFTWMLSTKRIRARALTNRQVNSDFLSTTQERFTSWKLIRSNNLENGSLAVFTQGSLRSLDAAYFLRLDIALVNLVMATAGGLTLVLSDYIMVEWVILERDTALGAMVAGLIGFVVWNVGAFNVARISVHSVSTDSRIFINVWMLLQDLFMGLNRAFEYLDTSTEVSDPKLPRPFPELLHVVEYRNVTFGYAENHPVLVDVSLTAHRGSITAVVGTTGSGKTTLVSLLLRIFEADNGEVLFNGSSHDTFSLRDLRQNVAVALQKNFLFTDTVANNIRLTMTEATEEQFIAAAQVAGVHDTIASLPEGYDTQLGERGSGLSGGQRQQVSIARAILRDAPILILDEPSASLDAETETRVMENLREWGTDRVVFLVTHRLSTLAHVDQVVFLRVGKPASIGTHANLMETVDEYSSFIQAHTDADERLRQEKP